MTAPVPAPAGPRFCRQCGASLRPGARFCHHCGTPLVAASAPAPAPPLAPAPVGAAPPMPAVASPFTTPPAGVAPPVAPPFTTPPAGVAPPVVPTPPAGAAGPEGQIWPQTLITGQAARGRPRRNWFSRLPALGKLAIVFGGLVVIGGVAQAALPSAPKCTYSCIVRTGPVQPTGRQVSGHLVSFYYPPVFAALKTDQGAVATLGLQSNQYPAVVDIYAGQGQQTLTSLVQQYAQKLSGPLQNLTALGPIYGAEIGFVPGAGEFYSADVESQNGEQQPIGLGIIAAQSNGVWGVVEVQTFCTDAQNGQTENCAEQLLDSQQENFGIEPDFFDDILAHWHWG
jgi:zinc-ribbon domain